jgi:tetratricopeptide (TPR) repeat protein
MSPEQSVTVTLLSAAFRQGGESGAVLPVLEAAQFRHPEDPWVHQELGLNLLRVRPARREDALRAFAAEAALRPESARDLAKTLRDTGRTTEAISALEAVLLRRTHVWDLIELGRMTAAVGRPAEARSLLERAATLAREALAKTPDDFVANCNLAMPLLQLGDPAGAIAAYRRALRASPGSAPVHINIGVALQAQGDIAGAIAEQRAAVRLRPDFATAHFNLGNALGASRDLPGAIAAFRESILWKPDDLKSHANLGAALSMTGDFAGAVEALRSARALARPGTPDVAKIAELLQRAERLARRAPELPADVFAP